MERRRAFAGELRVEEGAASLPHIRGYAAVYDEETELWPGYREVIRPQAFDDSLRSSDPKLAHWNHDTNIVLGSTSARTLRLWSDERGLGYDVEPPQTQTVADLVLAPIRRGDVRGSSFGFRALEAPEKIVRRDGGDYVLREVVRAQLYEVSPCPWPAYVGTETMLRALGREGASAEELLGLLRGQGLTEPRIRSMLAQALEGLAPERAAPRRKELERELEQL